MWQRRTRKLQETGACCADHIYIHTVCTGIKLSPLLQGFVFDFEWTRLITLSQAGLLEQEGQLKMVADGSNVLESNSIPDNPSHLFRRSLLNHVQCLAEPSVLSSLPTNSPTSTDQFYSIEAIMAPPAPNYHTGPVGSTMVWCILATKHDV